MGYDFHTVRRSIQVSLKLSNTELQMVTSAQHRRGYEHCTHYLRQLVWEDGASMAEPKLFEAATKERWPQQDLDFDLRVGAVPRNWDAEYKRLCGMVRAAMVLTPDLVPTWALQFNVAPENAAAADAPPASEAKPKKGVKPIVRAKRRSSGTK